MFWQPMMGTGRGRPPCCSQELSGRQPHPPLQTLVNSGAQAQGPLSHPGPSLSCSPVCEEGAGWAWPGVELVFRRQHVVWSAGGGSEQVLRACRGTEPVAFPHVNHNVCSCSRRLGAATACAVPSQGAGRRGPPQTCTVATLTNHTGAAPARLRLRGTQRPEPQATGLWASRPGGGRPLTACGLWAALSTHSFLPALSLGHAQVPFRVHCRNQTSLADPASGPHPRRACLQEACPQCHPTGTGWGGGVPFPTWQHVGPTPGQLGSLFSGLRHGGSSGRGGALLRPWLIET